MYPSPMEIEEKTLTAILIWKKLGILHLVRTQNFQKNYYFLPPVKFGNILNSYFRSSQRWCSWKSQKINRKTFVRVSFFTKVVGLRPAVLSKKTPTLMLFREFYEILKNKFFTKHLRTKYFCYFVSIYLRLKTPESFQIDHKDISCTAL